jgi:hypothetical protein
VTRLPNSPVLESEGEGLRLRMEAHYQPRPFPASLLASFFRVGFGRRVPGILKAIKEAAEERHDDRSSRPAAAGDPPPEQHVQSPHRSEAQESVAPGSLPNAFSS